MIVPELFRSSASLSPSSAIYMMVDPARAQVIYQRLSALGSQVRAQSMYQGDIGANLGHVLPWLVHLPDPSSPSCWFAETGFGQSWGSFVVADVPFEELRRHLRKFNLVTGPDGRERVFRFYDPRVLRRFLPECTTIEALRFFGPVKAFLAESQEGDALVRFALVGGRVTQTRVAVQPSAMRVAP